MRIRRAYLTRSERTRNYARNRTIYYRGRSGMFKSRYVYGVGRRPPRMKPRFKKPPVYVMYNRPTKAKRRLEF